MADLREAPFFVGEESKDRDKFAEGLHEALSSLKSELPVHPWTESDIGDERSHNPRRSAVDTLGTLPDTIF